MRTYDEVGFPLAIVQGDNDRGQFVLSEGTPRKMIRLIQLRCRNYDNDCCRKKTPLAILATS